MENKANYNTITFERGLQTAVQYSSNLHLLAIMKLIAKKLETKLYKLRWQKYRALSGCIETYYTSIHVKNVS